MKSPEVSVVMSVYNGAAALPSTLQSVLDQQGCDLEFIVVNDGSTDDSGRILDEWAARDARLRVIHQANTGLTRALMRGCAEARGDFIARQDCGDVSLPGRLARQVELLKAEPNVVMVACGASFIGPAGEILNTVIFEGENLHAGLALLHVDRVRGPPHHGGTMFSRTAYQEVGGYRAPFVVAQDIDLWLRLAERGRCVGSGDVGYLASLEAGSISGRRRPEQYQLGTLAIECAKLRRAGLSDQLVLDRHAERPTAKRRRGPPTAGELARFYYFVGSCLRHTDPAAARGYFQMALRHKPVFWRALWRRLMG